jgi:hypothetical protein
VLHSAAYYGDGGEVDGPKLRRRRLGNVPQFLIDFEDAKIRPDS